MRERTHLVCEHLEGISRDALEKYQDIIRGYVNVVTGCTLCIGAANCTTSGWQAICGYGCTAT